MTKRVTCRVVRSVPLRPIIRNPVAGSTDASDARLEDELPVEPSGRQTKEQFPCGLAFDILA